ncbi:MAG: hypothetical protein ABI584_07365 [Acidobacteriota bacterium]
MNVSGDGLVLFGVAAAVVLVIVLEGWRQRRIYGKPSGRPNLQGVGMLELQKHLQADRRVETLVELQRDESAETEHDEAGGPRRP